MSDLNEKIEGIKLSYREIFMDAAEEIEKRIEALRPKDFEGDLTAVYPVGSEGKLWQNAVLDMFENDISKEVVRKLAQIKAYRNCGQFGCKGCATCCNLACSEFSPEELKEKAKNGDNFANQFLSVFVPYNSREEAYKIYPEYLDLLRKKTDEKVYFYHCPKLDENNRCSDYENRPQICRDFPDNPFCILPKSCGYYDWREEIQPVALLMHSFVEIMEFYKNKISKGE
ncbi:YkgJ family cysteine cluster protein [bacterium]|nr:YkgJ family cysteine cluster protein [bacterium]